MDKCLITLNNYTLTREADYLGIDTRQNTLYTFYFLQNP